MDEPAHKCCPTGMERPSCRAKKSRSGGDRL